MKYDIYKNNMCIYLCAVRPTLQNLRCDVVRSAALVSQCFSVHDGCETEIHYRGWRREGGERERREREERERRERGEREEREEREREERGRRERGEREERERREEKEEKEERVSTE
jgi:hypothetical protein